MNAALLLLSTFFLVFFLGLQSLNVNTGRHTAAYLIISRMWAHRRYFRSKK